MKIKIGPDDRKNTAGGHDTGEKTNRPEGTVTDNDSNISADISNTDQPNGDRGTRHPDTPAGVETPQAPCGQCHCNEDEASCCQQDSQDCADDAQLVKDLLARSEKAEKAAAEYIDHAQRLKAEFDNFKKRTIREKADLTKFANENLLLRLLPVVDNLSRGTSYAAQNTQDEEILKGMKMVERQLIDTLAEFGAAPFESAGQPFDPYRHESLYCMENDELEPNTVVQEIETGWTLHDRVLRPAKVAVSRKSECPE